MSVPLLHDCIHLCFLFFSFYGQLFHKGNIDLRSLNADLKIRSLEFYDLNLCKPCWRFRYGVDLATLFVP